VLRAEVRERGRESFFVGVLYVRPRLCWWTMLARYQRFDDYTENHCVAEVFVWFLGCDKPEIDFNCSEDWTLKHSKEVFRLK
jgi:hypothetical protein